MKFLKKRLSNIKFIRKVSLIFHSKVIKYKYHLQQIRYIFILRKIQKKIKRSIVVKVVFIVVDSAIWKYGSLYKKFDADDRFEPYIVIAKSQRIIDSISFDYFNKTVNYFIENNYRVFHKEDISLRTQRDFKNDLNPDIIFYSVPYNYVDKVFYISNNLDVLNVYCPYAFAVTKYNHAIKNELTFLVWRHYVESNFHVNFYRDIFGFDLKNIKTSGYIGLEEFHFDISLSKTVPSKKKLIWAPHWTIDNNGPLVLSSFLKYSDLFLEIAGEFKNSLEIYFKPHPILKYALYDNPNWGKLKTDKYFNRWLLLENTNLVEGNYVELFNISDAIIHDSGSFTVEYLYTKKMAGYTVNPKTYTMLNDFGKKALNNYYLVKNDIDLKKFILNLINSKDPLKENRIRFYENELKFETLPSDYIIKDILKNIS